MQTQTTPLRVLCLDIEGGFGGSSRSLYYSLKHMQPGAVLPEVWCRKNGPVLESYRAIGIASRHEPRIVTATAIARPSRTLIDGIAAAFGLIRHFGALGAWARDIDRRFDVVHFNHEGLLLLALALRPFCAARFTFHIRRLAPSHLLARLQVAGIAWLASRIVCISPAEAIPFHSAASPDRCSVITNIVEIGHEAVVPDPSILQIPGVRIASMANYSWARGVDQLIDVAKVLKRLGRTEVRFVMMGSLEFTPSLPEEVARFGPTRTSIAAFAKDQGVADMFVFAGSLADPLPVLAACDVLAKPARRDFPWGRDILEAMAAGKPVVTIGTNAMFVESGVTGELMSQFDAECFAQALVDIISDPNRRRMLGENARARAKSLCDPRTQADALFKVWNAAARDTMRTHIL